MSGVWCRVSIISSAHSVPAAGAGTGPIQSLSPAWLSLALAADNGHKQQTLDCIITRAIMA